MTTSAQIKATTLLDSQRDRLIAGALFLGTMLSRVPFRSHILYHWDSVNFANAMRQFDVLQEHPQPPGYIVYVWLCRLVDPLFHDANATMVWISIVASSLAVVLLYLLGWTIWNRRVGLVGALFFLVSPLFWFYGEIALPHTLDACLVLLALWLLYRVRQGEKQFLWPAVVVLGVAGGVRQQTLVFLLPVALYAVWRVGWKRLLLAGLLGAVVCLTWFVPLMVSCGGIGDYLNKMSTFGARFQRSTSVLMGAGWSGITYNLRKLGMYTLYAWNLMALPLIVYPVAHILQRAQQRGPAQQVGGRGGCPPNLFSSRAQWGAWAYQPRSQAEKRGVEGVPPKLPGLSLRKPQRVKWERVSFIGLWAGPAIVFYTLIHMGQEGLVLVFLPALLVVSAAALVYLLEKWPRWLAVAITVVVFVNVALFCIGPEHPLGKERIRLLTRQTIANSDHYYADRFAAIREHFPAQSIAILAANWDHVRYYMPEYITLSFSGANEWSEDSADGERIVTPKELGLQPDSQGQTTLLLFDDKLASFDESAMLTKEVSLQHGGVLEYFVLTESMAFRYGARFFRVVEP